MKLFWSCITVAALMTASVALADFYRYETESGVLSFTDEEKRIPSRYRDEATLEKERNFYGYERLSIVRGDAKQKAAATQELHPQEIAGEPQVPFEPRIEISSNPSTTSFALAGDPDSPVRIERTTEWRWVDGWYRPYAIVKKDGKVISIIRLR